MKNEIAQNIRQERQKIEHEKDKDCSKVVSSIEKRE
jgi:hypothetical protein